MGKGVRNKQARKESVEVRREKRLRELYPNAPECPKCHKVAMHGCADCRCHHGCCSCGNPSKGRFVVPPRVG